MALAFRNAIASPGANPGRAVACASGLDEDRLIDIRNDEAQGAHANATPQLDVTCLPRIRIAWSVAHQMGRIRLLRLIQAWLLPKKVALAIS